MGIELGIAALLAAGGAGLNYYNTSKTEKKQDKALAQDIRNQGKKRAETQALTNKEIEKLTASRSADEKEANLAQYTDAIRKAAGNATRGLSGGMGGERFQQDAADASKAVTAFGNDRANTISAIDAPIDQRFGEGVSFGNLGVDIGNVTRQAEDQHFLDQLRLKGIKRNPWLDIASAAMSGAASAGIGSGGGSSSVGLPARGMPQ